RFRGNDVAETGTTLLENALQKARAAAKASGLWALADDTGLFVDALDGKPGVFSARYAGEEGNAVKNIEQLLQELRGVPFEKRGAHFETVMALVHPDGREVTVQGELAGMIAEKCSGEKGFGYDPVFWLPKRGVTLAELPLEEKNRISHRGKALLKMKKIIEEILKIENEK
ncbi:MAG: RdgB/HAM1 family non-canonical purine NTP pyrophosphatase, partial [bacterium]|nr:RdgB/HAM1 family non-canonical purine NTP pyrophosphatase [bacterium]